MPCSRGTRVVAIERRGPVWRVATDRGDALEADHVVLAVSARARRGAWSAGSTRTSAEALARDSLLGRQRRRARATARRTCRAPLDGYGYLVTRPERLATLGVVWESSLFPGRAPEGMALLRVFLGGARRPDVARLDAAAAIALARDELQRVMGITAAPARTWSFHWPDAIAQYTVGHAERVADDSRAARAARRP